jgi:hypothetical protein
MIVEVIVDFHFVPVITKEVQLRDVECSIYGRRCPTAFVHDLAELPVAVGYFLPIFIT